MMIHCMFTCVCGYVCNVPFEGLTASCTMCHVSSLHMATLAYTVFRSCVVQAHFMPYQETSTSLRRTPLSPQSPSEPCLVCVCL